jgi:hypothetical protein
MTDLHLNFIIRSCCADQSCIEVFLFNMIYIYIYINCVLLKYAQTVSLTVNNPLQCFKLFLRMFLSSLGHPLVWTCTLFIFFMVTSKQVNNMSHFTDKFPWKQGSSPLVPITMFRLISSTIVSTLLICTGLQSLKSVCPYKNPVRGVWVS